MYHVLVGRILVFSDARTILSFQTLAVVIIIRTGTWSTSPGANGGSDEFYQTLL